ncbi:hypothetical protein GA0074692_0875 [Micromonospora pallida]|uniref:Uncharacterized protein n=1 Tax=Micromonospora pallida TaxID=145854 RepID=A0A1C6RTT9_9ACTN|nr:hypothetical protein [Micromonospora pallida]SCL20467.1 hypothetical protein GA0074692_0875 [Micromonospora pallida]
MAEIVNLTPHPVRIFPSDTPDRIEPGSVTPLRVITPSTQHQPVRLGQRVIGPDDLDLGVPVERVAFGAADDGVPPLPPPVEGTYYLVSLVVGLAAYGRDDVLVCHDTVRDLDGSIIGVRALARPHRL